MSKPTIAKTNTINSYAVWLEQPEIPGNGNGIESSTSDALILTYSAHTLHIHSNEADTASVTLYTTTGQLSMKTKVTLINGHTAISLTALSEGTYIIAVTDSEGNTETLKITI